MKHQNGNLRGRMASFLHKIFDRIPKPHLPAPIMRIVESTYFKKSIGILNRYALLFHIPLSMAICLTIESLSRHSLFAGVAFLTNHFLQFLYNSYIIFILLSITFILRKRTALRLFISAVIVALGAINCVVLLNRVTPFGFTDLYMIGDLLTMKNSQYFTTGEAFAAVVGAVIYVGLMVILFLREKKQDIKVKLPIRVVLVVIALASFIPVTSLLQNHGIMASYFGNLAQGYRDYGFLYGFTTSVYGRGMDMPFLYGQDQIQRILDDNDMGESTIAKEDMPNVIVILLESFYDVSEAKFMEAERDPIPFFHYLEENFSSGYCTVPVVGAGTCNTEFEVLTGMSCQFFGPGEYPQKTILKETDCESYADILGDMGLKSHVVHNNGGNFYSRANAFSMMGFDSFTCKEVLDITEYTPLGSWPTDRILTEATKDALDSTEGSDFVYTITVETHGAYPEEEILSYYYTDVAFDGKDEAQENQWKYYIQMLHNEDYFIRNYINALEDRDEDTLVIMFGDHLPTMGLTESEIETGDLFKTKYVTWNNFGMEKEDMDLTSYQLVAEYLDRLGVHGGTILDYNQSKTNAGIRAGSYRYLNGLQSLQYDLMYGNRYAYGEVDAYPPSNINIGIKEVKIDRIYPFAGKLHIYGENFTPWSSVYAGGKKVKTTYESGQCLTVNLSSVPNGSPVFVGQVGSNDTLFRRSNQMYFISESLAMN